MKTCKNCGNELQDGWKICPFCGEPTALTCSTCGEKLDPRFKLCPICGTPVGGIGIKTQPTEPKKAAAVKTEKEYQVGETIVFGTYEQNGLADGTEDVEWIVLDKSGKSLLLISKHILDCRPAADTTWEESEVRTWLNGDFIDKLCENDENRKSQILERTVNNGDDKSTSDKVFLLSSTEVRKYFSSERLKPFLECAPTDYASSQGESNVGNWILRDGPTSSYSSFSLLCTIVPVNSGGIRPALWLKYEVEERQHVEDHVPVSPMSSEYNPDSDREQDDRKDQTTY